MTRQEINDRIIFLKRQLIDSDYKVLKFIEGKLSQEEYENALTQRQEWRDEINELEKQLKDSENNESDN